jgi:hypothetical protein
LLVHLGKSRFNAEASRIADSLASSPGDDRTYDLAANEHFRTADGLRASQDRRA